VSELLYLFPDPLLRLHPSNIRRIYRPADVAQMAASIKAHKGVIQALLIVPASALGSTDRALVADDVPDAYYVVEGNLRLTAARTLGEQCPPLKCEVVDADRAAQLLLMATTSEMVFAKDPISLALHYHRLSAEEGMSYRAIARAMGHAESVIANYIALLDLDAPIQELIAQGELPRDRRVRDALMAIPGSEARIALAERLARSGASIKAILKSCETLAERMEMAEAQRVSKVPALIHAAQAVARVPRGEATPPHGTLRQAVAETCGGCDVRHNALPDVPEPAWALVVEASQETCAACSVREIADSCAQCPTVYLLRNLMQKMQPAGVAR
jgi:ParB/RepB/Spo0J family partition protein